MELEVMMGILLAEVKKNNINIVGWSKSSSGHADPGRKIKIPVPVDFDTLGVCFHEIGHIVLGHMDENPVKKPVYVEEFEAEQYAIEKLKEYGYYDKQFEFRAISYVLMKIAQAKNRGHNMKQVPKEIVKWTKLPINKWNAASKVHVQHLSGLKSMNQVHRYIKLYKKRSK